MIDKPVFPLRVFLQESGEELVLMEEIDAATSLEWFDSEDADEHATVTDAMGSPVILKVVKLTVKKCEIKRAEPKGAGSN